MSEATSAPEAAPKWVVEKVVPKLSSPLRGLHVVDPGRCVVLFTEEGAVVARKGAFSGPKMDPVPYPKGLLLNASNCPHCAKPIREPVAKVARLAAPAPPPEPEPAPAPSPEPTAPAKPAKAPKQKAK